MSPSKKYPIDFVKRTKEIIKKDFKHFLEKGENGQKVRKGREVTFLLNCLLGLIVTVSENEKKKGENIKKSLSGKIDQEFLTFIPDSVGFVSKNNVNLVEKNLFEQEIGHKEKLLEKDKVWFVGKIRNGIAHQNIKAISKNKIWTKVKIWNENHGDKDFEIDFTIEELKRFALKIADDYLEANKQ